MRKFKVTSLSCVLLTTCGILSRVTSADGSESVPQLAPNQDDVMTSVYVDDVDVNKEIIFSLKVEGSPPLECKGWFIELGKSRYERANERFTCNNISENGNTFNLTVYPVERSNIGQYGVLFENNQGHWYFRFEIKDEEILWYVVIVTCSLLGLCFAITTTMIAVFCKRRARKRRQRRESESQQNGEGEAPLTMPPPPAYSQAVDNEVSSSGSIPHTGSSPAERPQPNVSELNSERPLSATSVRSDLPPSSTCVCGTLRSARKGGAAAACGGNGSQLLPDEAEIAEAIVSSIGRLRAQPTTLNINMYRSRRISRSVPDLFSLQGGKSHTLPRHVEDEEEDDEDFELPPNSKLFKERKGRRRQQPKKSGHSQHERDREKTDRKRSASSSGHKRPSSSEQYPRYVHDTSLHIFDSDGASGSDVIEVSSSCTRESTDTSGYISMKHLGPRVPSQRSPRERATSTRSTPGDAAPPPCGVTNLAKRVYENLIGEPYGCTQEVKVPLMPPKTKTFSYTSQLPLMSPGHVAATSPPDEERSTRLSHESTTVRIYKS